MSEDVDHGPEGVVATSGNGQVSLTWAAPSTMPDAWYWIETRPAGGTWQRLGLPITTCCTSLSTGLTNGTTYEFRVVTIGAGGEFCGVYGLRPSVRTVPTDRVPTARSTSITK